MPVRILFDTNVLLDAAVPGRSHHDGALELLSHVDRGAIVGLVAPPSFSTCWYVATAHHDVDPRPLFETVESLFEFALMNRSAFRRALDAPSDADFEDAYLAAAGAEAGADLVVTRNEPVFADGPLPPMHPDELASTLRS